MQLANVQKMIRSTVIDNTNYNDRQITTVQQAFINGYIEQCIFKNLIFKHGHTCPSFGKVSFNGNKYTGELGMTENSIWTFHGRGIYNGKYMVDFDEDIWDRDLVVGSKFQFKGVFGSGYPLRGTVTFTGKNSIINHSKIAVTSYTGDVDQTFRPDNSFSIDTTNKLHFVDGSTWYGDVDKNFEPMGNGKMLPPRSSQTKA